jgi:hypothetical protein
MTKEKAMLMKVMFLLMKLSVKFQLNVMVGVTVNRPKLQ